MRPSYLILLICFAAMAGTGPETSTAVKPEVLHELSRAIDLENQGQVKEAERIVLGVIRSVEASGGDSLELGVALNNLAVLYVAIDRYADAERSFLRSLRVLENVPGEVPQQVLIKTKLHLAALYLEMGRGADAMKLNVPPLVDLLHAPEDKARAKSTLAGLAALQNDMHTAEKTYSEALAFWMEPSRAATSQVEVATILNNLAVIAMSRGRMDVARERLDQSFAAWERTVGPANPNLAKSMTNVAAVCIQVKQYDEAAMWLGRATSIAKGTFGEQHPFTVAIQFAQAEALKRAGRKSEASQVSRLASAARKMMRSPSMADHTVDYRDLLRPKSNRR